MGNCRIASFLGLSRGVLHNFAYCCDITSPFPPRRRMKVRGVIYCTPRSRLQPVLCAEPAKSRTQEGPSRIAPPHVPNNHIIGFIETSSWDQPLPSVRIAFTGCKYCLILLGRRDKTPGCPNITPPVINSHPSPCCPPNADFTAGVCSQLSPSKLQINPKSYSQVGLF